jgi:hypothetical protein
LCWLVRRFLPVLEDLAADGEERACHWDREEGADDSRQLSTDENRAQDGQRRQLNGSSVDEWLKNVVLELLVCDEEDDHDEAAEPTGLDDDHASAPAITLMRRFPVTYPEMVL